MLRALKREGFEPFMVAQSRSRIPGKEEFTKHMIRLRKKRELVTQNETPEIVLVNSHDGTSSYQLFAGLFRMVCSNGMVAGDVMQDMRVHHKGDIVNDVIDAACRIIEDIDPMVESMEDMKQTILLPEEQQIFANSAHIVKYGGEDASIQPNQLLTTRRQADKGNDLWSTLNVVQENMLKGGLRGETKNGRKKIKSRSVSSIDNNIKYNRALWSLAEQMGKLHRGESIEEPIDVKSNLVIH